MWHKLWLRYKRSITIIILILAPFFPLALMKVDLPRWNFYANIANSVIHPISELLSNTGGGVGYVWNHYLSLIDTSKKNDQLKLEKEKLEKEILDLKEAQLENERLHELMNLAHQDDLQPIYGKVVGQDTSPVSFSLIINVGSRQGVEPGMGVVTDRGVAGMIVDVFPFSSVMRSILDPRQRIDGFLQGSRARGLSEGTGTSLGLNLKYLDRSFDVRVGDMFLTSGLDQIFPKGILVGDVVKVDRPAFGVLQQIDVRPAVDFGSLENVMIVQKSKTKLVEEPQAR